ncbi:MAG: OmpA family protein [Bacteroidetes bacterium]|nr:OmpA family protein [Bacteroidota bacterium]
MTRTKKVYAIYALCVLGMLGIDQARAQNYLHKFGFEISGGIREYGGDRGTRYFLAEKPDYQAAGGSFSYYINSMFDATVYGSVGMLGHRDDSYPVKLGFTAHVTDLMFGLRYKLANGKIMSEQARFKPYLQAGYGGMQSISHIVHNVPGYGSNRTWFAAQWSAGGGVRIRLTDYLDLSLQMLYNYTYDDNYDGLPFSLSRVRLHKLHDAYLYHTAGFVYHFSDNPNGGGYNTSATDEVPKEAQDKVDMAAKNIYFETGSSTIKQESFGNLDSIVAILLTYPTLDADIEGYTDDVGDDDDNQKLSQERADAVRNYIISKGVDGNRLTSTGYGEKNPIAKNNSDENRAKNRRVEVHLKTRD